MRDVVKMAFHNTEWPYGFSLLKEYSFEIPFAHQLKRLDNKPKKYFYLHLINCF